MHRLIAALPIALITACAIQETAFDAHLANLQATANSKQTQKIANSQLCIDNIANSKNVMSPKDLFKKFSEINFEKGEFESTPDYDHRILESLERSGVPLNKVIYVKKKFNPDEIFYDADASALNYSKWGVSVLGAECSVFRDSLSYRSILDDYKDIDCSFDNKYINLINEENAAGSYIASNAFGLEVEVTLKEKYVLGIFESSLKKDYYGNGEKSVWTQVVDNIIFQITNVDVPTAKQLKNNSAVHIGFQLKKPYLVTNSRQNEPTIHNKTNRTTHYSYVIADLQCATLAVGETHFLVSQGLN